MRTKKRRWLPLLLAAMLGTIFFMVPTSAHALPRGEGIALTENTGLYSFVLPDGRRVYCLESDELEPTGDAVYRGEVNALPGKEGKFHAYTDPAGIRKINFLITEYGQRRDNMDAAATQMAIWMLRAESGTVLPLYASLLNNLRASSVGKQILARADELLQDAAKRALPPVEAKPVTSGLELVRDEKRGEFTYELKYPKGTKQLRVTNGIFEAEARRVIKVSPDAAGSVPVRAERPGETLSVSGTWESVGRTGYPDKLQMWEGFTADGVAAQRVAFGAGAKVQDSLTGEFSLVTVDVPPPLGDPQARSVALATANAGEEIHDVLIIEPVPDTTPRMWEEATASFTAYLLPEVGAPKYDRNWQTIPVAKANGVSEKTARKFNSSGVTNSLQGESAGVSIERWSAEEIASMTVEELCKAQPVYVEEGVPVTAFGELRSKSVISRSAGTVNWVEKVVSDGEVVHEGACGVPSEKTEIVGPEVVTKAQKEAKVGEAIRDVAIVTAPEGSLEKGEYSVLFRGFKGKKTLTGMKDAVCDESNLLFTTKPVPVRLQENADAVGPQTIEVPSPSVVSTSEFGDTVWWVETLVLRTASGESIVHEGDCGLPEETTSLSSPDKELAKTGFDFVDSWFLGWGGAALVAGGLMLAWQKRRQN